MRLCHKVGAWSKKREIGKIWYLAVFAVGLLLCLLTVFPVVTKADVYNSAYAYVENYGTVMRFEPTADNQKGVIYYATKAKKGSVNYTRYSTQGWKVKVIDASGAVVEELYLKIGGDYIHTISDEMVGDYSYTLYGVALETMKSLMSEGTRQVLERAGCQIVFDACMIVKRGNSVSGGMNNDGSVWGTVYTTYEGIASAEYWSQASMESLKTFFNKTVEGLFCDVYISGGEGVRPSFSGGRYCYGTTLTVEALLEDGYEFVAWEGYGSSNNPVYSFVVRDSTIHLYPKARLWKVNLNLYRNAYPGDRLIYSDSYDKWGFLSLSIPGFGWEKTGHTHMGWAQNMYSSVVEYERTAYLGNLWENWRGKTINLFALWRPNSYDISFHGNGGAGNIDTQRADYGEVITMPSSGFYISGCSLEGWTIFGGSSDVMYFPNQQVSVTELAGKLGLENTDQAEIKLYAVWDEPPEILAFDLYVSLEDAAEGCITEEWIAQSITATDREDGSLSYGKEKVAAWYLVDYSPTDFIGFRKEGSVSQTIRAVDSVGNASEKRITIYVVDNRIYSADELMGRVRFLSETYYKDENGGWILPEEGGLWLDSVWRLDKDYESLLDVLFYGA